MIANLLVVSADDFPLNISRSLEKAGFILRSARGVLKSKEILNNDSVDTIVWVYMGHERALARDLLELFNKSPKIPIVFITQSYDELDFAEEIKGLFANLDLNDEVEEITATIETACNQLRGIETSPINSDLPEVDFKNALSRIMSNTTAKTAGEPPERDNALKKAPLWDTVDSKEKRILSGKQGQEPRRGLSKVKGLFHKSENS